MSETWRKIEELYYAALELENGERTRFLIDASAGDDRLRLKVEELLKAHELADDFLCTPALEVAASAVAETLQQESLVGRRIGHYEIQSLLGVGGMGEVYLARDGRQNRTVALKILPAYVAQNPERLQRFVREAKAASAFNHPNIAAIYDIGEDNGVRFIALEYVEGETLAAKIASHSLDIPQVIAIGIQVSEALSHAHAIEIVHRDIKPGNVMVTPGGQVKVLDFGLAKSLSPGRAGFTVQLTQPGAVMGTVQYMSPEQILGRDVDHRTDIFSLGVVLYEMAAGNAPFADASTSKTKDLILHAAPKATPSLTEESELTRIINKCLEKQRNRRYQSARDLSIDLQAL